MRSVFSTLSKTGMSSFQWGLIALLWTMMGSVGAIAEKHGSQKEKKRAFGSLAVKPGELSEVEKQRVKGIINQFIVDPRIAQNRAARTALIKFELDKFPESKFTQESLERYIQRNVDRLTQLRDAETFADIQRLKDQFREDPVFSGLAANEEKMRRARGDTDNTDGASKNQKEDDEKVAELQKKEAALAAARTAELRRTSANDDDPEKEKEEISDPEKLKELLAARQQELESLRDQLAAGRALSREERQLLQDQLAFLQNQIEQLQEEQEEQQQLQPAADALLAGAGIGGGAPTSPPSSNSNNAQDAIPEAEKADYSEAVEAIGSQELVVPDASGIDAANASFINAVFENQAAQAQALGGGGADSAGAIRDAIQSTQQVSTEAGQTRVEGLLGAARNSAADQNTPQETQLSREDDSELLNEL